MKQPIIGIRATHQWFPFGRGDRGSRQRIGVSIENWPGIMKLRAIDISVFQVGIPIMLLRVGYSSLNGDLKPILQLPAKNWIAESRKAIRFFSIVRRNNRIIQTARKRGKS